jgi:hypothetical protein
MMSQGGGSKQPVLQKADVVEVVGEPRKFGGRYARCVGRIEGVYTNLAVIWEVKEVTDSHCFT